MGKHVNVAKGNAKVGVQLGGTSIKQSDNETQIRHRNGATETITTKANGLQDITFTDKHGTRTYSDCNPRDLMGR